jgi:hypothetical protein
VRVGFFIFAITTGMGYLKKTTESKNSKIWVFEKRQRMIKFLERIRRPDSL